MTVDLARAIILLDVVHKVAAAGPGLNNLTALAAIELNAMNDEAGDKLAKDKEEANKKAAAEAAAKAKDEEARAAAKPVLETVGERKI